MTEQQTNSGTLGGAPGGSEPGGTAPSSFVRDRVAQMQGAQPAPGAQPTEPAADARQQQQTPPAEQKIRVGDAEFEAQAVSDALAAKAEADVRKTTLPKSEAEYLARNSANFQLPEGVKWEFNETDPLLAQARKFALARGMDQETFSGLLDLHVASRVGELTQQAKARDMNMQALGAAGPQRVDAVATWLAAKAGKEGAAVSSFIRQYPMAPMVKAFENLIRQFSNQGGADFSQSHRAAAEDPGKIPGYENMSFAQKRAYQMQQQFGGGRPGGRRGE